MVEHAQFEGTSGSAKGASTTVASSVYDQIRLDILKLLNLQKIFVRLVL